MDDRTRPRRRSLLPLRRETNCLSRCWRYAAGTSILLLFLISPLRASRNKWNELNIGPFRVDTNGDVVRAREILANLEQMRWILGGWLEDKNLEATFPFRVVVSPEAPASSTSFILLHGQYICAVRPGVDPPYAEVAKLMLESNTTRLPSQIDSSVPKLFESIEAHGSQVTWAKRPANPDVDWARVQLFATKPEYAGRFRIFLNNLRGGSLLLPAEANAFGKDSKTLEAEVAAYFASGAIADTKISARPLDPKGDFGEHAFDDVLANVYLGDVLLKTDSSKAEQAYKAAGNAGYQALAQEGLALISIEEKNDPREYLDAAMAASSKEAWVFVKAAETRPPAEAIGLLKIAQDLNPRWWLPTAKLAELTDKPAEKERLLIEACRKNPRSSALWQELAELQSKEGKGSATQNSWIRAEDAAASPEERQQIHRHRQDLENQRLDAQDTARRHAADVAQAEDARVRNDELARIRAAEERANGANSTNSAAAAPSGEVAHWWNSDEKPVDAVILRVDCLGQQARLHLKTSSGKMLTLLVADPAKIAMDGSNAVLACGPQPKPRSISLNYKPRADRKLGTTGDVLSIHFE
jgi:hypothetical protein